MPTSLLSADTKFPNFSGSETTEEKVDQITNYLYMLVEQLRYSMANIGAENFNETEFDNIVNLITEPIYFQLTSEDGTINQMLHVTEDRLISKIEGVTKGIEELGETTTLIQQTVNSITMSVSDLSGKYTSLQSTVNGLTLTAFDNGSTSTIALSANGTTIASANITLSGMVTFTQVQTEVANTLVGVYNTIATPGATTIDGGNIQTGVIKGVTYYSEGGAYDGSKDDGSFIVTADNYSRVIGGIKYYFKFDDGAYADKLYLYTTNSGGMLPSIKLYSVGNVSIDALGGQIYMETMNPTIRVQRGGSFSIYAADAYGNETHWQFVGNALYCGTTRVF